MLAIMMRSNVFWALLAVGLAGFGAGNASAQSSSSGDWFDGSGNVGVTPSDADAPSSEPGSSEPGASGPGGSSPPDYAAPPPDFQTPPAESDSSAAQPPPEAQTPEQAERDRAQGTQEFSPQLAPYGYWIDDPWYGRVWVPSQGVVGAGFSPYVTGGHWALTPNDEWLWTSDYPFGWVTFHYGRWAWCAGGVWGWVPGYVYAPAWVQFRIGSAGYIGWGPLPPYYGWRHGGIVALGYRRAPVVYVPTRYAFERSVQPYVVRDRYRARSIGYQTRAYRPVAGVGLAANVAVRSPSPAEAHVPARVLPAQRVLAQPRFLPAPTSGGSRTLSSASAPRAYSGGGAGSGYPVQRYGLSGTRPLPSGATRPRTADPGLPNGTLRATPAPRNGAPRAMPRNDAWPSAPPRNNAPGPRSTWQGYQGPPSGAQLRPGMRRPFAPGPFAPSRLAPATRAQPIAPGAARVQPSAPRPEGGARQRPAARRNESNERGRGRGSYR